MSPPKTLYDNGVTQHHIIPPLHCNFSVHVHVAGVAHVADELMSVLLQTSCIHCTPPPLQEGRSAFHYAAREQSIICMRLLVYRYKCDPDEKTFVSEMPSWSCAHWMRCMCVGIEASLVCLRLHVYYVLYDICLCCNMVSLCAADNDCSARGSNVRKD